MKTKEFFEKDRFAHNILGIEIAEFYPGYSKVSLNIKDEHLNGFDITQGGVIFTLADYALAVASNAEDNTMALSTNVNINYLKPTTKGDRLTAQAKQISKSRKLAVYEINIYDKNNSKVAIAIGNVYIKS